MMKKVFALLMAVVFAGGIVFSGPVRLCAETEEEAEEDILHEDTEDAADDEQLDMPEEDEYEEEEQNEEEDQNYPEEKYQDDRG